MDLPLPAVGMPCRDHGAKVARFPATGTFGRRMRLLPLLTLLVLCSTGMAQQGDTRLFTPWNGQADSTRAAVKAPVPHDSLPQSGKVNVAESTQIKALMADYAARRRPLDGYRIQIFLGDRAQAETIRRSFLVQHADIPAYLSYLAPNFRVRVGDLRDRVEAENLRETLRGEFPGLYVVPDQIEPPRLPGTAQ